MRKCNFRCNRVTPQSVILASGRTWIDSDDLFEEWVIYRRDWDRKGILIAFWVIVRGPSVYYGLNKLMVILLRVKVRSIWPGITLNCDIFWQSEFLYFSQDVGVGKNGNIGSNDLVSTFSSEKDTRLQVGTYLSRPLCCAPFASMWATSNSVSKLIMVSQSWRLWA